MKKNHLLLFSFCLGLTPLNAHAHGNALAAVVMLFMFFPVALVLALCRLGYIFFSSKRSGTTAWNWIRRVLIVDLVMLGCLFWIFVADNDALWTWWPWLLIQLPATYLCLWYRRESGAEAQL